eukprot:1400409-Prorocentrum_lima.AAC.1
MTSSLVGSEMCIRDRGEFETFTEAWVEIRHIRYGRPLVEAKTQPNSLPVSYTHLTLPTICSV